MTQSVGLSERSARPAAPSRWRQACPEPSFLWAAAVIAVVTFLAHFYLFDQFGLYEDDYCMVLPWLHRSWHEVCSYAFQAFIHPAQGRPIYGPAQAMLASLAYRAGGLGLAHLVSYGLLTLLGLLFNRVLCQVTSPRVALLASLVFVLYPADTSRQIIMHQCATLLPMCVCMAAILLYAHGKRAVSYAVAATTLLVYESTYFPFLLAPLFASRQRPLTLRTMAQHAALFFVVSGGVFGIRLFFGESRVQEVSGGLTAILPRVAQALWMGPLASGTLLVQRPLDAFLHGQGGHWLVMLACGGMTGIGLFRLARTGPAGSTAPALLLFGGGVAAWVMSYLLDFRPDYFPPVVSIGRLSAVHEVGAFGCCVALAGVLSALCIPGSRALAEGASVLLVAGLAGFGYEVQVAEYASHWQQQHRFWNELWPLIQDVRPGETVICAFDETLGGIPATQGFTPFGQPVYNYKAFSRFLTLPAPKSNPPMLRGYNPYTVVERVGSTLIIKSPFWDPAAWTKLHGQEVVWIKAGPDHLERYSGDLDLHGYHVVARPMGLPVAKVGLTKFFMQLFEGIGEGRWSSLREAKSYPP
ncbi:MAG TPA: hypothetical protein VGD78_07495 [Chthoniobacterales bacterium]